MVWDARRRPCRADRPRGRRVRRTHQSLDTSARVLPALSAQLGVNAGQAVNPALGSEDTADVPAQLGFRLGAILDGGGRVQPGVEAVVSKNNKYF